MHDFLRTNLNLRATTLEPIDLSIRQFLALFEHRLTWIYLGFVLVILLVSDPSHLFASVPLGLYAIAWVAAFILYICVHAAIMLGLAALRYLSGRTEPAIYWPVVSLLAFAPTLVAMETSLSWAAGDALRPLLLKRIWYVAVTVIMFETIFTRFVLPRVAPSATTTDRAAAPALAPQNAASAEPGFAEPARDSEDRKIHIGSQPISLGEVSVIEAREHHVHVRMHHGTLSQRARLSDIVAQTRDEDGIQPHRSWWVPRHSVRELGRDAGKPVLRLTDESVIPVARGRLETVRHWIATHVL